MKRRLMLLVAVTTSLVLVAFLVPLALLVRTVAADRATNSAIREAESLAPLVTTTDRRKLAVTTQEVAHDDANDFPLTVYLPDGRVLGASAPVTKAVRLARSGRSLTVAVAGGRAVLVAAQGGPGGTVVIRAFVSTGQLWAGVWQTWLILALLAVSLLGLSLLVATWMARSVTAPIDGLVGTAHRLAEGDLAARITPAGPAEVRAVASGLNVLADRIGELLTAEREHVADLSHQLRTPLTALRLGVDAIPAGDEQERLTEALETLERTVDRVIREARRPVREGVGAGCDAVSVTAERVAFWQALADDEQRTVTSELPEGPVPVRAAASDLTTAIDALLGNVFAHTPDGADFSVLLEPRSVGGAIIIVRDNGPGLPEDAELVTRGFSHENSTGLGLDIARRTAAASGGELRLDRAASGGAEVSLRLGPPPSLTETASRGAREGAPNRDSGPRGDPASPTGPDGG